MDEIKTKLLAVVATLPESVVKSQLQAKIEEREVSQELIEEVGAEVSKTLREHEERAAEILAKADDEIDAVLANYTNKLKELQKKEEKKQTEDQLEAVRQSLK